MAISEEMKLNSEINKYKINLINKAKKKGIYENFGQKEIALLKNKFGHNHPEIDDFDYWASNFNLSDLGM